MLLATLRHSDDDTPLFLEGLGYPCTGAVIAFCCIICYLLNSRGMGYADVGSSYRLVVKEGQWWRTLTASFSHFSIIHLGFNMYSTWQLRNAELVLGMAGYMRLTFVFLIMSIAMQLFLHGVLARTRLGEQTQNTIGVGFSCVVFAWMTWASLRERGAELNLYVIKIPFSISPFASLIITQFMIPNVDFVGHLSGILAGYLEGWGLLSWLQGYWAIAAAFWVVVGTLYSLKRTAGISLPGLQEVALSDGEQADADACYGSSSRDPWRHPSPRASSFV